MTDRRRRDSQNLLCRNCVGAELGTGVVLILTVTVTLRLHIQLEDGAVCASGEQAGRRGAQARDGSIGARRGVEVADAGSLGVEVQVAMDAAVCSESV